MLVLIYYDEPRMKGIKATIHCMVVSCFADIIVSAVIAVTRAIYKTKKGKTGQNNRYV